MTAKPTLAALAAVACLTACGDAQRTYMNVTNAPRISAEAVTQYNREYVEAIRTLRSVVGSGSLETAGDRPIPVGDLPAARDAAFAFVDAVCDDYLKAVFATHRARLGVNRSLVATGAATTAILGLTGAASATIGIVAAAFGLGSNLLDGAGSALLYELDPAAISDLVLRERSVYRHARALEAAPGSEGMLLAQVQGYVRICTPMAIEARVNDAIRAAQVEEVRPPVPANGADANGSDAATPSPERLDTTTVLPRTPAGVPLLRVTPATADR